MTSAADNAPPAILDDAGAGIQEAYRASPRRATSRLGGQRLMIAEIARTIAGVVADDEGRRDPSVPGHVCVVEAGTGTGKTVGYVLGAVPVVKARGLKLVIATATVALQDQLVARDLPDLVRETPLGFRFALAKGRGRYACVARLDRHVSGDTGEVLPRSLRRDCGAGGGRARGVLRHARSARPR